VPRLHDVYSNNLLEPVPHSTADGYLSFCAQRGWSSHVRKRSYAGVARRTLSDGDCINVGAL
jgi:hypothetical protein